MRVSQHRTNKARKFYLCLWKRCEIVMSLKKKKKIQCSCSRQPNILRTEQRTFISIQRLLLVLLLKFMTSTPNSAQNSTKRTSFLTQLRVRCRKNPKPTELQSLFRHVYSPLSYSHNEVYQSEPRVSQARLGAQPLRSAHGQTAPTASLIPAVGSAPSVTFGGPHQLFLFNAIKQTSGPFLQVLFISP